MSPYAAADFQGCRLSYLITSGTFQSPILISLVLVHHAQFICEWPCCHLFCNTWIIKCIVQPPSYNEMIIFVQNEPYEYAALTCLVIHKANTVIPSGQGAAGSVPHDTSAFCSPAFIAQLVWLLTS